MTEKKIEDILDEMLTDDLTGKTSKVWQSKFKFANNELIKFLYDFSEKLIGEDKPPENIMRAVFRQEQRLLRDKLLDKIKKEKK